MYAIIQIGSHQHRVEEGDVIETYRMKEDHKKTVKLDVLLCVDGSRIEVGTPFLKNVVVQAKAVRDFSGEKVTAFKYRRRKSSAWKKGHRQKLTALEITSITAR